MRYLSIATLKERFAGGSPTTRRMFTALALSTIFLLFMGLVQFATPDMPDNDGYYHIKLAYLMRTEGLKPDFPYLPLTVLNEREFSDHHFLFHVALIPFTFGDLRLGAKWASIIFASIAFLSVWFLFDRQKILFPGLWALGVMAISQPFIYRMSIARAQSLSLAFLVVGLALLLEKKYRWLGVLAFLYVWLYNAFPLILALTGAYVAAILLLERRFEWRPLLYVGIGVFLGVFINPYFPQNVIFLGRHLFPKFAETTAVSVGSEWYPYSTLQLVENSPLALVAFLSGVLAMGLHEKRMDVRTAAGFFLSVGFGLMLFQSRRFIEYFPPFALIFAAFAWAALLQTTRSSQPAIQESRKLRLQPAALAALILLVFIIPGSWLTLRSAQDSLRTSKPYRLFADASEWLAINTEPGERIFQTDWDDFPRLFFYNTHNTYLSGLDPTYMQLYNPSLYDEWVAITRGKVKNPSEAIQNRFAARYVVSDLQHNDFIRRAAADPAMEEVYRDDGSVVYRISE